MKTLFYLSLFVFFGLFYSLRAEGQCTVNNVNLTTQAQVDAFHLAHPDCSVLPYSLEIQGDDITNLDSLFFLTGITLDLRIDASKLKNIDGLAGILSVGRSLSIYGTELTHLNGLSGLKEVKGHLTLSAMNYLQNVDGLSNLKSVGYREVGWFDNPPSGYLMVYDMPVLQNLNGLAGVEKIDGALQVYNNPQLSSIEGLRNINQGTITEGLRIENNGALSVCNLPNICTYLAQGKPRTISGNLGTCATALAVSQACSGTGCPATLTFFSQAEVDAFGTTYPHCATITGNVGVFGANIVNLNGLAGIQHIGGGLQIGAEGNPNPMLQDISGLANLKTVGGGLLVYDNALLENINALSGVQSAAAVTIIKNNKLKNIDGLSGLSGTLTGGVALRLNPALENINGLSGLQRLASMEIDSNVVLQNLDGLSHLSALDNNLYIRRNDALQNVNGLSALQSIASHVEITHNPHLQNLSGLGALKSIGGNLLMEKNPLIQNLDGLSALQSLAGYLNVSSNDQLRNLNGLQGLPAIGGYLYIADNPLLNSIQGLANINPASITFGSGKSGLYIQNNGALSLCNLPNICSYLSGTGPRSITGNTGDCANAQVVSALCSPSCPVHVTLNSQQEVTDFAAAYSGCNTISGNLRISGATNLSSLSFLQHIGGDLYISVNNPGLLNLDGLGGIQEVGGDLTVSGSGGMSALTNINGLSGVKSVGRNMYIGGNPSLQSLGGLSALKTVGGSLTIQSNGFNDLTGLSALQSVGEDLVISFGQLESLDGLSALNSVGKNLSINYNTNLKNLNGLSPIQHVGGDLLIYNNTTLQNISGISNIDLSAISRLVIRDNAGLASCAVSRICNYLVSDKPRDIQGNNGDCADELAALNDCSGTCPKGPLLNITSQAQINSFKTNYPGCSALPGSLMISGPDITNLAGLSDLQTVNGNLLVSSNPLLENMDGLAGIQRIKGQLGVADNTRLNTIDGLKNIDPLTITFLTVTNNGSLSVCGLANLCAYLAAGRPRNISGNLAGCSTAADFGCSYESCPTGNIVFNTQSQITSFEQRYSHCSTLPGSVYIQGTGITDLSLLSFIRQIGGNLVIGGPGLLATSNMTSLQGLHNLESIGGLVSIHLNIKLQSLDGLNGLKHVGGSFSVSNNDALQSINSLPVLETVGGSFNVSNNKALLNINGLGGLQEIEGNLMIGSNALLQDVSGFSSLKKIGAKDSYGLGISNNPELVHINGLAHVEVIGNNTDTYGANVFISNNPKLQNLNGLSSLHTINDGAISVTGNPLLQNLDGLSNLRGTVMRSHYGDALYITNNNGLKNIDGLKQAKFAGGVFILNNPLLENVDGLISVDNIAGNPNGGLNISGNSSLKNLNGLSGLHSIQLYLIIQDNPALQNISGLGSLQNVGDRFVIKNSPQLQNLGGLSSLTKIGGGLIINDNAGLKDLDALTGLSDFSGALSIERNPSLNSIQGIANIPPGSITNTYYLDFDVLENFVFFFGLSLKDNGVLSICNLPNICAYLALPSGSNPRSISGNLGNCATEAAVTAVCGTAQQTLTLGAALNPTLCGAADGRIGFTTSLEAGPYTLSFKRGTKDTTAAVTVANGGFSLTGLGKGIYKGFAITHTEGMVSATGERTLTDPAPYSFAVGSKSDPTGCGDLNGRIVFTTNLDAESYLLRFKKGSKDTTATVAVSAGGFTLSGLSAATYSAFSISSGGCSYLLAGPVELLNPQSAGGAITAGGPLELCEGEQVQLTAPAGASYEWSTGAGGRSIWASTPGVYKVKVKSGQGCISESQITVSRKECNVPPMAVCKPVVVLVAGSDCQALLRVEHLDAGSYDKDNDWFTRSIDINPLLRVGSYKATLTLVDIKGASTSCQSTVHVVDHTAPVIQARSITVSLNTEGRASITPADVDAGSYDGCGGLSLSIDRRDFDCRDLGQRRQVILKGTDASGNEGTAVAFIQVVDNLPPVVTTKAVRLTLDQNGRASLKPEDLAGSMWDNCSIWNVTASKLNFDCNDVGENKVTLRVEDVGGGATEAEVTVTVVDNTPPVLQAQAITLYLDKTGKGGVKAEQVGAASTDNCGLDSLALSRTEFSCDDIGENEIQLKGWDKSGNESELMITITVADTIRPVIVARDVTLYLDDTGRASLSPDAVDGGSTDNCGIESRELQKTGFSCNERGIHTIQYRVKDKSGNESTAEIRVTVKDTTAPVAQAQDLIVELDGSGKAALTAGEINDGSYDNCAIETMEISQSSFSCSDLGKRLITLTVRDGSGNTGSIRAEILIRDPEGVCPCSYGILAQNKVVLRSNRVHAGGIGVSGSKGMVKLRNTLVDAEGTFVKSERTRFDNESESSVYMRGRAPEPEGFRSNDKKEKKTERVKKNGTQTFTAGSYGRIKAKKGAKLIFSGGDVQIRSLKLGKGGQVSFGGATALLVRDYVKLGKETEFNGAGEQVRVYSGGQVKIRSGSEVKGYVHSRGSVKTTGRKEKYLEGFFAGDRIRGSRNTEWSGGGVMCKGGEDQVLQKLEKGERRRAEEQQTITADSVAQGKALWVRIWPNPVRVQMRVEVAGETEGGQVMLVDLMGNVLRQQSYGGRTATLEMQTEKLEPGLYVLRVSSGGEVVTLRIVKNER